ncbi:MAG: DUF1993 domain-containing protein [Hyphomicrobiaceae bacterium]|nr:MAG: DUF1993 domain-containing protein [Hyphomicrobiaceae bacterium]
MALSMYQASVPVFQRMLANLEGVLEKAEAYAGAKKIDPSIFLNARLSPDMFPLSRQVQLASDFAKGAAARLAGMEIPKYEDSEKTFAELRARLTKTQDFLKGVKPAQIDGSEGRDINLTIAQQPATLSGQNFLLNYALPHFFFHVTTAYGLLRSQGVEIGKRDYMGSFDGLKKK